jgi:hypothetical protein
MICRGNAGRFEIALFSWYTKLEAKVNLAVGDRKIRSQNTVIGMYHPTAHVSL